MKCNASLSDELESLGDTCSIDGASRAFREMCDGLNHASVIVREGSIFGLERLAQRFPIWAPDVVAVLSDVSTNDSVPTIREVALSVLEDL